MWLYTVHEFRHKLMIYEKLRIDYDDVKPTTIEFNNKDKPVNTDIVIVNAVIVQVVIIKL